MERLEIRFHVRFVFEPDSADPCKAEISCYLPARPDDCGSPEILPVLRSHGEFLFGDELDSRWGKPAGETHRMWFKWVRAKNWQELDQIVRTVIDEAVEILRRVKNKNTEMERSKPADLQLVYEI